jgi:hypothetical protein
MPTTTSSQKSQDDSTNQRQRLELSVAQVSASAFAAVTATVGASYLGVTGTVIGAAVASVLTVVANAIYLTSLHRTRERLVGLVPAQVASRRIPLRRVRGRPIPWRAMAVGAVATFVVLGALVTLVEAAAGRPLTDIVRNQPGQGTSFLGGESAGSGASRPPTHTPSTPAGTSPAPSSSPTTSTPSPTSVAPSSPSSPSTSASAPSSSEVPTDLPTP